MANEMPAKAMLNYIAEQIGADPASFDLYARREETRMNHVACLLGYLEMKSPTAEDRRAALLSAINVGRTAGSRPGDRPDALSLAAVGSGGSGALNLVGLAHRIAFLRTLEIDPRLQRRIASGRWDQMVREGDATPAWLANDFNAGRRRATIVAQIIKLGQKLTDDAVMMFIKLIGRLFSQANNRKKQRHMSEDLNAMLRLEP